MKKQYIFIFLIVFFAFFIRLLSSNTAFISEENVWVKFASDHSLKYMGATGEYFDGNIHIWPHPPLALFIYKISGIIFNNSTTGFRLVPILFGTLSILLVYVLANKFISRKTAIISSLFMCISFWHILASTEIDMDGSILTFIFLLFIYAFLKYEETKHISWLLLTGIVGGIGLLAKFTTIAFFLIVGIYALTRNINSTKFLKKINTNIKNNWKLLIILLISISILVAYLVYAHYVNYDIIDSIFAHGEGSFNFKISLKPILSMIFFGTPLVFIFMFFYFIKKYKEWNKLEYLSTIWISVMFLIYFLLIGSAKGPFERYLMILIPPIAILSGSLISKLKFTLKEIRYFIILTLIYFGLMFLMNSFNSQYIGDNPQKLVSNVLNFNLNINIPIMANTEPGIWISFPSILLTLILIGAALSLFVFKVIRKNHFKKVFIFILAVSLGINLFYVQEYIFHSTHPDFSNAAYKTIDYYKNSNLSTNLYSNQHYFFYYLNKTGDDFNYFNRNSKIFTVEEIKNSSFIVGNYYTSLSDEQLLLIKSNCILKKSFSDKGYILIEIYSC